MSPMNIPVVVYISPHGRIFKSIMDGLGSRVRRYREVSADRVAHARVISREHGVICGRDWVDEVTRL